MAVVKGTDFRNEDALLKYILESRLADECSLVNVGIVQAIPRL